MAKKRKEEKQNITTTENILLENSIDSEKVTEDLKKYIDERINKVFIDELDKTNKKLIREKSRKILVKNIVIIILLGIIGFLIYILYSNNYFDRFFSENKNEISEKEEKEKKEENEEKEKQEEKKEEKPKEPTLDELKEKYASLLDNYVISDKSVYLKEFYDGSLTSDLKKYFTLNSLDFASLKKEDDYQIISNEVFKLAYERLFDDGYNTGNFDYNDNKIRYVNMIDSYMTISILEKKESLIKREIEDIKVGNDIKITTVEGIIKEGKLYNILDNNGIEDYKDGSLLKYSDKLNKITYVFKNNKLTNLEK